MQHLHRIRCRLHLHVDYHLETHQTQTEGSACIEPATSSESAWLDCVGDILSLHVPVAKAQKSAAVSSCICKKCLWMVSRIRIHSGLSSGRMRLTKALCTYYRGREKLLRPLQRPRFSKACARINACSEGRCEKLKEGWHARTGSGLRQPCALHDLAQ